MAYFFDDPFARLLMAGIAEVCDGHGAGMPWSRRPARTPPGASRPPLVDGFIVHCLEDGDRLIGLPASGTSRSWPSTSTPVPAPAPCLSTTKRGVRRGAPARAGPPQDRLPVAGRARRRPLRLGGRRGIRTCNCKVERDRLPGYAAALAEHDIQLAASDLSAQRARRRGALHRRAPRSRSRHDRHRGHVGHPGPGRHRRGPRPRPARPRGHVGGRLRRHPGSGTYDRRSPRSRSQSRRRAAAPPGSSSTPSSRARRSSRSSSSCAARPPRPPAPAAGPADRPACAWPMCTDCRDAAQAGRPPCRRPRRRGRSRRRR